MRVAPGAGGKARSLQEWATFLSCFISSSYELPFLSELLFLILALSFKPHAHWQSWCYLCFLDEETEGFTACLLLTFEPRATTAHRSLSLSITPTFVLSFPGSPGLLPSKECWVSWPWWCSAHSALMEMRTLFLFPL